MFYVPAHKQADPNKRPAQAIPFESIRRFVLAAGDDILESRAYTRTARRDSKARTMRAARRAFRNGK